MPHRQPVRIVVLDQTDPVVIKWMEAFRRSQPVLYQGQRYQIIDVETEARQFGSTAQPPTHFTLQRLNKPT